ncbi:oligoribonuclease [Galactobacter valiniphilus]|uniref:Oligoribonuclease n=1 Tax=Galactobacter valiniphilus TaxID=2676122 RepID=A0A399JBL1_9MICC|nr:oligoribonuclease [Galactobacter valiniphilus]RII41927.1 oligoribonuclease [Galactobacter valiniphilus]
MNNALVWIDCEMTGLDLHRDALIEVAVVITDANLNVLDPGLDVVIKPTDEAIAGMNDFVRNMHVTSGLLEELPQGLSMREATDQVLAYIKRFVTHPGKALLAGNSVGNDKNFLVRDMPKVIEHLHYRIVDVSSIKELARRWYPNAYFNAPAKTGNHRALGDIIDSINELKYYREAIMVPAPGPSAAEAQGIAAELSEG